jgi:hypothetical protein
VFLIAILLSIGTVWAVSEVYTIRLADTPGPQSVASLQITPPLPAPSALESDTLLVPADEWLERHGWKQIWPIKLFNGGASLFFAGPPTQRYLRLRAKETYYIWARPLDLDPHQFPFLTLIWGVEQFPQGAALDVYKHNDRAVAVIVSFGPEVRSGGLIPDVPRGLAFFWGETETPGATYTCISPRQGPDGTRMQCKYPHVKYIALRRGGEGSVQTDQVNLLEHFQQQFPDYWQQYQRVPPMVGVSFEARSDYTDSVSSARLYSMSFSAQQGRMGQQ